MTEEIERFMLGKWKDVANASQHTIKQQQATTKNFEDVMKKRFTSREDSETNFEYKDPKTGKTIDWSPILDPVREEEGELIDKRKQSRNIEKTVSLLKTFLRKDDFVEEIKQRIKNEEVILRKAGTLFRTNEEIVSDLQADGLDTSLINVDSKREVRSAADARGVRITNTDILDENDEPLTINLLESKSKKKVQALYFAKFATAPKIGPQKKEFVRKIENQINNLKNNPVALEQYHQFLSDIPSTPKKNRPLDLLSAAKLRKQTGDLIRENRLQEGWNLTSKDNDYLLTSLDEEGVNITGISPTDTKLIRGLAKKENIDLRRGNLNPNELIRDLLDKSPDFAAKGRAWLAKKDPSWLKKQHKGYYKMYGRKSPGFAELSDMPTTEKGVTKMYEDVGRTINPKTFDILKRKIKRELPRFDEKDIEAEAYKRTAAKVSPIRVLEPEIEKRIIKNFLKTDQKSLTFKDRIELVDSLKRRDWKEKGLSRDTVNVFNPRTKKTETRIDFIPDKFYNVWLESQEADIERIKKKVAEFAAEQEELFIKEGLGKGLGPGVKEFAAEFTDIEEFGEEK